MKRAKRFIGLTAAIILCLTLVSTYVLAGDPPEGPGTDQSFDGSAYFFWQGADGKTNYKAFNDLKSLNSGNNFMPASDISSDVNSNIKYVLGQKFEWVSKGTFDANKENLSSPLWNLFDIADENQMHDYTMNPSVGNEGNNSVAVTPNMDFRIFVINEDYRAITVDSAKMKYPDCAYNDTVFGIPYIDISGTDQNNPADVRVFLSENKVAIGAESESGHSKAITSVKALDVGENCVSVEGIGNGLFEITFHSDFYDKVVFEVKDSDNHIYYVRVFRTAIEMSDNFGPEQQHPAIIVRYTYEADAVTRTGEIPDVKMVATVRYNDGTSKIMTVYPEIVEDMFGESTQKYEMTVEGEEDLRICQFSVDCPKTVATVSVSVQKESNGQQFAGALLGSGEGVTYDVEAREVIY